MSMHDRRKLEEAIERVLEFMTTVAPESDDYKKMTDRLIQLYGLQAQEHERTLKDLENIRLSAAHEEAMAAAELEREERLKALGAPWWKPSGDTLAIVLGNLVGIAVIVGYERGHVMTSKALGSLFKTK